MSSVTRKGPGLPAAKPREATDADLKKSGRATVDDRGQTVWEWQVHTGRFDLNADSQRIRALTDVELSLAEPEPLERQLQRQKEQGFSPYAQASAPAQRKTTGGINPDSTGPAKRPERSATTRTATRSRRSPGRPDRTAPTRTDEAAQTRTACHRKSPAADPAAASRRGPIRAAARIICG